MEAQVMGGIEWEVQHGVGPGQGWMAGKCCPLGSCSPWMWGQAWSLPTCCREPPTHPSALYWLVPGMPAPCCAVTGLNVVATFRAFMAFSFLL